MVRARSEGKSMTDDQIAARLSLDWVTTETCLRLPPSLQWHWCDHTAALESRFENMAFSFHVADEQHGARKIRIAVLKAYDDCGCATWEAPIPPGADGVEARK